ncbi:O-antigen ligase family protein [Aggregicoccus sp. 17bor-14]|uniref:O-antigen ligase family protein n=1 Tax=Myxococcaceae TaxID=31 RepID=UPI00129CF4CE|nr:MULTISPECIES: O-antigen ligase family protein [Myxococcaceae]MBF5041294.1 O-antigen ligase family protein [Simulacricoccus sp. 17bor-14]MRI87080.1 O-antigen ligase family protein [Aggregicoccus sp. 17bor-14]
MSPARASPLSTLFAGGLALWGAGCLWLEALAPVGMALCAVGALAWLRAVRPAPRPLLREGAALLAFLLWALLAPTLAGHPPSGTGVARTLDFLGIPVAALALALLAPAQRRRLALGLGALFLVSCALAALQYYGLWPSLERLQWLRWTRLPLDRVYEEVPGAPGRFMGGGLPLHRLKFAHVGGFAVVAAFALGLRLRGRERAFALAVALVGLVSVGLFPYARAAAASLVVALGLMLLLGLPRRTALAACAALALAAVLALGLVAPLRERFRSSLTSEGSGDRSAILATGLRAVRAHPIAGVGPGRFRPSRFAGPDTPDYVLSNAGKAHNQLLSMAAETGMVGALLFVLLGVALARRMSRDSAEGLAGLGALAFFCVLSAVHDPLFHAQVSAALPLVMGLALVPRVRAHMPPGSAAHSPPS